MLTPISARRIVFENDDTRVEASGVRFAWRSWTSLVLDRSIELTEFSVADLVIRQKRGSADRGRPPDSLALPISLRADRLAVDRIELRALAGTTVLSAVRAAYNYDRVKAEHTLRLASLDSDYGLASGDLALGANEPFEVSGALALRNPRAEFPYQVDVSLGGMLRQIGLGIAARVDFGEARGAAVLQPYERLLVDRLVASAERLDPRRVRRELPEARLNVQLSGGLDASGQFAGSLRVENSLSGPLDRTRLPFTQLTTMIEADAREARLRDIVLVDGPARITGRGTLDRTHVVLDLNGIGLDAQRIDSRLKPTRLAGQVAMTLAAERQSAKGRLTQEAAGASPPLALDFDLARSGDAIDVRAFTLTVARGALAGNGTVALTGGSAFKLNGTARDFDPATIGQFPQAQLSGNFTAEGVLRPERRIDARFALERSRWRGFALEGRGDLRVEGERVSRIQTALDLAGNKVEASGAFGAPGDVLKWNVDAARLDTLGLPIAGRVNAAGTVAGTSASPQVEFTLEADRLRAEGLEIGTLAATGRFAGDAGEGRAVVRTARFGDARFIELTLDAKGGLASHQLVINGRGDEGGLIAELSATL
ncbi:MAG: hypothetical protein ABIU95_06940, partial [Burkholderiales bacterium]